MDISTSYELLFDAVVAGHGPPTHEPNSARGAQTYTDIDTGTEYKWFNNSWHPLPT